MEGQAPTEAENRAAGASEPGPKFPNVHVQLVGRDGNAFAILGAVKREMRKARLSQFDIGCFENEVKSGDYDHLLQTCIAWVDVS